MIASFIAFGYKPLNNPNHHKQSFSHHRIAHKPIILISILLINFLSITTTDDNMSKSIYANRSVIKFRGGAIVLYPLAKHQSDVKLLHERRVHVTIISKD